MFFADHFSTRPAAYARFRPHFRRVVATDGSLAQLAHTRAGPRLMRVRILVGYISTWSATVLYQRATGENPLPGVEGELASVWGDRDRKRPVVWPLRLLVGGLG